MGDRDGGRRDSGRPGSLLADRVGAGLVSFEAGLYVAVGLLLAVAAVLVLAGTVTGLFRAVDHSKGAVEVAVVVLDRILRTHEIVVEPFLYIGLIAVVRRILIVTAEFERTALSGRALTNLLLELGLLALLVPSLALAIFLVRR